MMQSYLKCVWLLSVLAIILASYVTVILAQDKIPEFKQSEMMPSTRQSEYKPEVFFFWKNGLFAETSDQEYRFHFGGRLDFDNGWYQTPHNIQDSLNTPLLEGTAIRRLRVGFDGFLQKQLEFKLEADFTRASEIQRNHYQSTIERLYYRCLAGHA